MAAQNNRRGLFEILKKSAEMIQGVLENTQKTTEKEETSVPPKRKRRGIFDIFRKKKEPETQPNPSTNKEQPEIENEHCEEEEVVIEDEHCEEEEVVSTNTDKVDPVDKKLARKLAKIERKLAAKQKAIDKKLARKLAKIERKKKG